MYGFTKQQARIVIDKMRNEALIILVGKRPAARYIRNCESSDDWVLYKKELN